jgi:translation initiation factor 4G
MCRALSSVQVPAERRNKDEPEVTFRKLLVNRCQAEFEKNSEVELNREAKLEEIEQTTDPVSFQCVFGDSHVLGHMLG